MRAMQLAASGCLASIAAGTSEQCDDVVGLNALPALSGFISSDSPELRENALCALGNIAARGTRQRDHVLQAGVLPPLLQLIETATSQAEMVELHRAAWCLSHLMRGTPLPASEQVASAVPVLVRMLAVSDAEVRAEACWALSRLADGRSDDDGLAVDSTLSCM
jgi:hypothetical protein